MRNRGNSVHSPQIYFIIKLYALLIVGTVLFATASYGQSNVTAGLQGFVYVDNNKTPAVNARVRIVSADTQVPIGTAITNSEGYFVRPDIPPGSYNIVISLDGYQDRSIRYEKASLGMFNDFIPPQVLQRNTTAANVTPTSTPPPPVSTDTLAGIPLETQRGASFTETEVRSIPLGGKTLIRSFDQLALLVPGVTAAPEPIGSSVGPGVGPGVGTSGQFSVNGLNSRSNNFMVDGSDNNDEDIGVRRQGFFSLVPQPIESVKEFQIITLLAPAQYGRNMGGQVNVVSKSGTSEFHGTVYGFFNSDKLNARNFFDFKGDTSPMPLTAGGRPVQLDGAPLTVQNPAGDQDSLTLFQGGGVLGGPIVKEKTFFFVAAEGQVLNATRESHFAVPTVEQRGFLNSGATGITTIGATQRLLRPTTESGNLIFSLFPFPNDPNGVYGRNTLTQLLSADGRGLVLSGKVDHYFSMFGSRLQTLTARYNFTNDSKELPVTGGAIFSGLKPRVRTDNFSTYLTGDVSDTLTNLLRFSWGRTRLRFDEIRDTSFMVPSSAFGGQNAFLLNAPSLSNNTVPGSGSVVDYRTIDPATEPKLGAIGQVIIGGFSPVGVDVFNFPQGRVNNTLQFADTLRSSAFKGHNLAFGADIRHTQLQSDLPRNSRPVVTFYGAPNFTGGAIPVTETVLSQGGVVGTPTPVGSLNLGNFISPLDLVAAGAPTGYFQSLVAPGNNAEIDLRYYQLDFFAQDDWRVRPNLLVSYGLRYEYNTAPKEADDKIESTFAAALPPQVAGFGAFIDGRDSIFEADRNNLAPRFGIAYSPTPSTVVRGGYGLYYDQILGAVVSQSRNVFPTFTTVNFGGGLPCYLFRISDAFCPFTLSPNNNGFVFNLLTPPNNPQVPAVVPGTLNTSNIGSSGGVPLSVLATLFPLNQTGSPGSIRSGSPFGATLPARELDSPLAHQYFVGVEQQLGHSNTFLSVSYVGTTGRDLLRFTTPNLGSNYILRVNELSLLSFESTVPNAPPYFSSVPTLRGFSYDPSTSLAALLAGQGRPSNGSGAANNVGPIMQFETTGRSQYHSLQFQVRGRLSRGLQYQANYTLGNAKDDVSDVFDLAGSPALPQNSLTFGGEYGPSNFDARHKVSYSVVYDLPRLQNASALTLAFIGGWQFASAGRFRTGQPFTVNSIFDVNLDGNLTDRLDNTSLITANDGNDPIVLLSSASSATELQSMLAAVGTSGSVARNTFRGRSLVDLDLAFSKRFFFTERQNLQFRVEVFNFLNRANFAIPVRFLEAPGFGRAVDTVTPGRRVQLALKYQF